MTSATPPEARVIALDPIPRGFGFAVLELPGDHLVEWGVLHCGRAADGVGRAISRLAQRLEPTAVVIEDPSTGRSVTRRAALERFGAAVAGVESGASIRLVHRARLTSLAASLGAVNKSQLTDALIHRFPVLAERRPPHRHIWQSEDVRFSVFDAIALALASPLASDRAAERSKVRQIRQ